MCGPPPPPAQAAARSPQPPGELIVRTMKLRERGWLIDSWLPANAGRLLDAGCARGDETAIYAQRATYAAGIELNPADVIAGRERHPALELEAAACEAIPFPDGSFDTAICADVLEHVQDEVKSLAELRRVLTPGGQ